MAKVKIKEGSLSVSLTGKNGNHHGDLVDHQHQGIDNVIVFFTDYHTRYTFRSGQLVGSEMEVADTEEVGTES